MLTSKRVIGAALILGMLAPLASFAETSTVDLTTLLNQIKTLQAQIQALQTQRQTAITTLVQTLKQGSSGDQVKILQSILAADPSVYPEGLITGIFGPKTAQAVARFQKKNGLEAVGNVGPKTLAKLNDFLKDSPLAFEEGTTTGTSTKDREDHDRRPCAIVPPGHLIAPGWLKKNDGVRPIVPACQTLPPGIQMKLGTGTTTPPPPPPPGTTTPDTIAPVISNIGVTSTTATSTVVSWTTNENTTGKVYYGTTNPVDITSSSTLNVSNSLLTTAHSFSLTGLASSTTYFYVLESKDAANNTATSSSLGFATSAN